MQAVDIFWSVIPDEVLHQGTLVLMEENWILEISVVSRFPSPLTLIFKHTYAELENGALAWGIFETLCVCVCVCGGGGGSQLCCLVPYHSGL
jgi:hypothetical protein